MFREIIENVNRMDNRAISVLLTRLAIRYITRLLGYRTSSIVFSSFVSIFRCDLSEYSHLLYTVKINIYRNRCMYFMSREDNVKHKKEKREWAQFVVENSRDQVAIDNAKDYLELIYNYNNYNYKNNENCQKTDDIFYIYGPNSNYRPTTKYNNCVIILTKPIDESVSMYKSSKLFLNSYYFNNVVANDTDIKIELLEKYNDVYVSCIHAELGKEFKPIDISKSGYLSGAMALGRVLHTLVMEHGEINCIIEGFDFYLDSKAYNSKYPSSLRKYGGAINERGICQSLIHHDAEYNFLYVKKIASKVKLLKSPKLIDILDMDSDEYMKELFNTRDFSKL